MLGYLEVNTEVSDIDIKTIGLSEYKKISEINKIANSMLAIIYGGPRFSYKDKWKVITLYI